MERVQYHKKKIIKMKLIDQKDKIFIAGSTGMVGNAIKEKLYNLLSKFSYPTRKDLDLTNYKLVFDWFKKNKPDIVIIAAAKVGGIYANNTSQLIFY